MSNCKNCNSDDVVVVPASTDCNCPQETESSISHRGKFYDIVDEDFIVPNVGNTANLIVPDATLWHSCQWVAICFGSKQYAFFRVLDTGAKSLKILNGCIKGDPDADISSNPTPGTKIPSGSIITPSIPVGCDGEGASQNLIDQLKDLEEIYLSSVICMAENEEVELLGLTKNDCDCAPPGSWIEGLLRRVCNIFTKRNGKTLCFSDPGSTTLDDVEVDEETKSKGVVVFDENNCLKKLGPAKNYFNPNPSQFHEYTKVVNLPVLTGIGSVTYNWDDLSLPEPVAGRTIKAAIYGSCLIASTGPLHHILGYVNGSAIFRASGEQDFSSGFLIVDAIPGGSVTFLTTQTAGVTSSSTGIMIMYYLV